MPTVAEVTVTAYAHCPMALCPGSEQVAVQAVRRETSYTYMDRGGDLPGVESSKFELVAADESDALCPSCGRLRELSLEPRKQYAALSGFDPNYLKQVAGGQAPAFDPTRVNTEADEKVAALEAQVARLSALVEKAVGDEA